MDFHPVDNDGTINDNYLDGISITIKRDHVWLFVAGRHCSCKLALPSFVGSDWTCDEVRGCPIRTLCKPLLWESQQCRRNTSYWFKELKQLSVTDRNKSMSR